MMSASRMSAKLLDNRYFFKMFLRFNRQYCHKIPNEHSVVRIGCASGFWGDTAVAGKLKDFYLYNKH